jgi:hypothetical protein
MRCCPSDIHKMAMFDIRRSYQRISGFWVRLRDPEAMLVCGIGSDEKNVGRETCARARPFALPACSEQVSLACPKRQRDVVGTLAGTTRRWPWGRLRRACQLT